MTMPIAGVVGAPIAVLTVQLIGSGASDIFSFTYWLSWR
jgi:hypothetical protein